MSVAPHPPRTIDEVLADARSRLERVTPAQADAAHRNGAVVVDIRPAAQRAAEGDLPLATVVERNVLEWRFDPTSEAALQDLGIHRATDVIGGYAAWRAWQASAAQAGAEGGR